MITRRRFLLSSGIAPLPKFAAGLFALSPLLGSHTPLAHAGESADTGCRLSMNRLHALVAKDGELFLICQPDGSIPPDGSHGHGLFYHDCRYLSASDVTLAEKPLKLYGADQSMGYRIRIALTNEPFTMDSGQSVHDGALLIESERLLNSAGSSMHERLVVHNVGEHDVACPLRLSFRAEFESVYGLRGMIPKRLGTPEQPTWENGTLWFRYKGIDGKFRALAITMTPGPDNQETDAARYAIHLRRGESLEIQLVYHIRESVHHHGVQTVGDPAVSLNDIRARLSRNRSRWQEAIPTIHTDNVLVNRVIDRSFQDLHTLQLPLQGDTALAAGVPWFVGLFGRDSLVASMQVQAFAPDLAAGDLRLLARYQGRQDTGPPFDEQPGKILHELRVGEGAGSGRIPATPYYGSIDSTLWYVITFARYLTWTGDLALWQELRPHMEAALTWMDLFGDRHGEDLVRYSSAPGDQLANKGWKDSGQAIVNADGSQAQPPIALVAAQGYAYQAKELMADLYDRLGERARAALLRQDSSRLRRRFNRDFWVPSIGFYAMALQKDDKPAAVVSSNPGHALWSGIVDEEKAKHVGARLLEPDMFSGWGLRTLSLNEQSYSPISYERGSVWPFDTALAAAGLRRYGFDEEAGRLFDGLVSAASHFPLYRLPEVFCGFSCEEYRLPIPNPKAEHPQAWSAGAIPYMLVELLGLRPNALDARLEIVRPVLPPSIQRLELEHLRVGEAVVDLRFRRRRNGQAEAEVVSVNGRLDVSIV
jgi:glycogen debranching enzyme